MDLSERSSEGSSGVLRHPWEVARFAFFKSLVAGLGRPPAQVLDAGAGDGWFATQLVGTLPGSEVTCWDAYYTEALMTSLGAAAPSQLRFVSQRPSQHFDLIMVLDVLEHIERDAEFLGTLVHENLSAEGTVLISVPAWQALFTAHDTRLRHYRRYAPAQAASLITQCGLRIVRRGGLFHGLLLPRTLEKGLEVLRPRVASSEPQLAWDGGALLTAVVSGLLAADGAISHAAARVGLQLPGLSWWALCRKR
jgi:hypothetical protein